MKVWMIILWTRGVACPVALFTTEQKAKDESDELNRRMRSDSYEVEEWGVEE